MIKQNYNSSMYLMFRVVRNYLLPYKCKIFFAIFFMILTSLATTYRAYLIKPAIDKIFVNKDLVSLYLIPVQIMVVALVACIANYIQGVIMSIIHNKINLKLQSELFSKLIKKDINFFKKNSSSKINAFFGDIGAINEIISVVLNTLFLQTFTLISLVGLMFYNNWKLSIISFIAFPTLILPLKHLSRLIKNLTKKNKNNSLTLYGTIGEIFDNISIVKSNNTEKKEIKRIDQQLENLCKINIKMSKRSLISAPLIEAIGTLGFAGVILYGGISVINGTSTTGNFFTFMTAMLSAYKPAKAFSGLNIKLQNAMISAKRYFCMLDRVENIKEGSKSLKNVEGYLTFNNVYFSYPLNDFNDNSDFEDGIKEKLDKEVLHDINLNIKAGKSYALVGHSGSGKSTIFNLILRFYDVSSGEILLDGENIKNLTFKTLRNSISLVSQDVKLFNDTIYNNIKYAREDATKEEIFNAAKLANVEEFVNELQDGYETIIGPGGSMISGGQKQRISIARAFLRKSEILLLDEATSALDPISEMLIKESLHELTKNKTTLIIAHRLSTIVNCDHIFVFEHGELKEQGSHSQLIALDGIYKNLHDKQFGNNEN